NNTASTPVVVDAGITVTDPDSSTLASATVTISSGFQTGQDVLAFVNTNSTTYGNIVGTYNSGTGLLILTSAGATATVAQWQAALRAVTYTNSMETPNTSTRTISFVVNDGTSNSNTATKDVSVASTNDAPLISAPGSITVLEDVVTALTGISFTDVDAGSGNLTSSFNVPSGTFFATSAGGVTVSGSGTTSLTLSGSLANLNTFLSGSGISWVTAPNAT
ncbi:MAG: cell wall-binding protein, partial [Planctomycetia bacterium]